MEQEVKRHLFDASSILAYFNGDVGAQVVKRVLQESQREGDGLFITAIQVGEVYLFMLRGMGREAAIGAIQDLEKLGFTVVPTEPQEACQASELKNRLGLHYSDAVAVATAIALKCTVVTSDPDFEKAGKVVKILWTW